VPRNADRALSTRCLRLDATTMTAPSRWAALAVARPMPDVPPRITTRFPLKLMIVSFECKRRRIGRAARHKDNGA
jgi:hypothetical protein